MFAVWQASHDEYPGDWFNGEHKSLAAENLLPFLTSPLAGKNPVCWTSDQSRYTRDFGYTYPEIAGIEKGHAKKVQELWSNMYSWARRLKVQELGETWPSPPSKLKPLDLSGSQFFQGIPGFIPLRPSPSLKHLAPTADLSALAVSRSNLKTAPAFSSDPSADINEGKVSREWYVDMMVEK